MTTRDPNTLLAMARKAAMDPRVADDGRTQMHLGPFIRALDAIDATHEGRPKDVYVDYAMLSPTTLDSYRGFYDHLALGFTADDALVMLEAFRAMTKATLGATFTGWKGGDYVMGPDTPLWLANPGRTSDVAIVGVRDDGWAVVIETRMVEP